ncbi:MAG: sugar phosphate isomerase/epimerase, partial [Planctomycetia bacterium]
MPHRHRLSRRSLLAGAASAAGLGASRGLSARAEPPAKPVPFKISLAQWSLHKTLFAGKLDNLDFPKAARREFGIEAVEYVNQFFKDKARDSDYIAELAKRSADEGVTNVLVMCD